MSDDVQKTVYSIIVEEGGVDESEITPASTIKDLGIASLDAMQILFEIEDHYKIEMPDDDPNFDTESVQGLVDTVKELLTERATHPPAA